MTTKVVKSSELIRDYLESNTTESDVYNHKDTNYQLISSLFEVCIFNELQSQTL